MHQSASIGEKLCYLYVKKISWALNLFVLNIFKEHNKSFAAYIIC